MKRIGIGFTAIIAILAMSFTFASKSGKVAKADLLDGCYTFVKAHPISNPSATILYSEVSNAPVYASAATIYTSASNFPVLLTDAAKYTLLTADGTYGTPIDPEVDCPFVTNPPVCCYEVENNKVVFIKFGQRSAE